MHKIVDRIETAVQLGFRLKYAVENNILRLSCNQLNGIRWLGVFSLPLPGPEFPRAGPPAAQPPP